MNGKRSSLNPDKLNKIVFIHDNFDMIVESAAVAIDRQWNSDTDEQYSKIEHHY